MFDLRVRRPCPQRHTSSLPFGVVFFAEAVCLWGFDDGTDGHRALDRHPSSQFFAPHIRARKDEACACAEHRRNIFINIISIIIIMYTSSRVHILYTHAFCTRRARDVPASRNACVYTRHQPPPPRAPVAMVLCDANARGLQNARAFATVCGVVVSATPTVSLSYALALDVWASNRGRSSAVP